MTFCSSLLQYVLQMYYLANTSDWCKKISLTFQKNAAAPNLAIPTSAGAHWARIQKKVQKPPQSTHQIPGFFCQKIQKEWIVEEFSLVNFSKKFKNWQKSMKRVVIP